MNKLPEVFNNFRCTTPVVFLIFNRPDTTERVFAAIRSVCPQKLLIVADGARLDRIGETDKVAAVRAIVEQVDWDCEVLKNYAENNLGCRERISSGLNWVFQIVEEAIILEDDCLPDITFFQYSEELLEKYRYNEKIMHISGDNFQFGKKRGEASYYYSHYAHVWGWATWRRAWKHYNVEFSKWTRMNRKDDFLQIFSTRAERRFWKKAWDGISVGQIDSWAFQWVFTCLTQKSLSIMPNVNLVSNIGFGLDATHTSRASKLANIPTSPMEFPIIHPVEFIRSIQADEYISKLAFQKRGFILYVIGRINSVLFQFKKVLSTLISN